MIFAKGLRTKRFKFIILMLFEEILLTKVFRYTILLQITYTILTYMILKFLYKEKAQITDIFTFIFASLIMLIINAPVYIIVSITIKNFIVYAIIARILLFSFLFCARYKLYTITKLYKKLWNRNDSVKKIIKTTTFRSINIILFNLTFYLVHIILLFELTKIGGV